jgi:hypothetical protein
VHLTLPMRCIGPEPKLEARLRWVHD